MSAAPRPDPATDRSVTLHLAASRVRAAVGVGGYLPLAAVRKLHPAFSGAGTDGGALPAAAALCGMRADAEGDGFRFSDPSAPHAAPAATPPGEPTWQPPVAQLAGRRAFVLSDGPVPAGAAGLVALLASRLGGMVRAADLRSDPSLGGLGISERLRALNALVATGRLSDASPDPAAAAAWRAKCEAMLALVARSGKAHAPFAALRLGLSSPAEANLVGTYLCDRGMLRKAKGAYLAY